MAMSNAELLRKAAGSGGDGSIITDDFAPTNSGAAALSIEQATDFISLLAANQVFLPDVRTVLSNSSKWQEALLDFGGRITKPGVQSTRLAKEDREIPETRQVEISTVLLRAEAPVSDEVMEDNIAHANFGNELEALIADQVGFDIEELLVNGDTDSLDDYLAQLDGWLTKARGADGHVTDASGLDDPADFQQLFLDLLVSIPNRAKRNLQTNYRYYVPVILEQLYRDRLTSRNTSLGDISLTQNNSIAYQGIPIIGAPSIPVANDNTTSILLASKNNLYAGFRRNITIESFRDPREGVTSFVATARVDAQIGVVDFTAIADNVDVNPNWIDS